MRALVVIGVLCALCSAAAAQTPPELVAFQGRLIDEQGPVTDAVDVEFRLFAQAANGTPLWEEAHQAVEVEDGIFSVLLGQATPMTASVVDEAALFLEVQIGDEILSPRMSVVSVPYALRAGDANTVGGLGIDELQRRVTGFCAAGSAIREIAEDGGVICETDDVGDTGGIGQITAGFGLTGGGSGSSVSLGVDTGEVQSRVTGMCAAGSSIRAINSNGTVTCEVDTDTDTITTVVGGTGINVNQTGNTATVAADTGTLQRRVTGTCASGAIQTVAANGTVTCASFGDITGVSAGSGLDGGGTSGSVTLAVDPTDFNGSTPAVSRFVNELDLAQSSTYITLDTITITAAGPGFVHLSGTAMAFCANCTDHLGESRGWLGWDTNQAGTPPMRAGFFSKYIPQYGPEAANPTVFAVFPVTAGSHTFYLRGNTEISTTDMLYSNYNMSAVFIPN